MAIGHWIAAIAVAGCALMAAAQDKDTFTPMPLDSGFGRMDLSDAASIPPEQIIKQFSAKETEFQEALNHYTYRRVARVQTTGRRQQGRSASGTKWTT